MARRPRLEEPGAIHHVFARGVAKRRIYRDTDDRLRYMTLLIHVIERYGWRCFAYCLMDNHLHLMVQTPEPNLGVGMRVLHGDYGAAFNARYGLSGHVFQGRYGSVRVLSDAQFLVTAAYIALNPVEAHLCERARDYAWSSHRAVVTGTAPPWLDAQRLCEFFGAFGGDPLQRYAAFVDGPEPQNDGEAPQGLAGAVVLDPVA